MGGHRAGVLYLEYRHLMGKSVDEEANVAPPSCPRNLFLTCLLFLSPVQEERP